MPSETPAPLTPTTPEERAAMRAYCEAATKAPWSEPHFCAEDSICQCRFVLSETCCGSICEIDMDNGLKVGAGGNDSPPPIEARANGKFISHARIDFPRVLADLEWALERIAKAPCAPGCEALRLENCGLIPKAPCLFVGSSGMRYEYCCIHARADCNCWKSEVRKR